MKTLCLGAAVWLFTALGGHAQPVAVVFMDDDQMILINEDEDRREEGKAFLSTTTFFARPQGFSPNQFTMLATHYTFDCAARLHREESLTAMNEFVPIGGEEVMGEYLPIESGSLGEVLIASACEDQPVVSDIRFPGLADAWLTYDAWLKAQLR